MIKEKLIISDTNIFIDLISINVLDKLFLLPCDICTTDFVVNEIKWPNQRAEIDKHIITKDLEKVSFGFDELVKISGLHSNSSTSLTDCSVWYLAKKTGGRLLTGDGKLRKSAEKIMLRFQEYCIFLIILLNTGFWTKQQRLLFCNS